MTERATPTHCPACRALLAECGDDLFPMYSRKLLIRGLAGHMSAVERRYVQAHRPLLERQLAALARGRSPEALVRWRAETPPLSPEEAGSRAERRRAARQRGRGGRGPLRK